MSTRKITTQNYLLRIQASSSEQERQKLAWEVVNLNRAAAVWLARRFCAHPDDDDISEANLALYDAALYCIPDKGSAYISVACWYFMRRVTGKRNAAGIHVPANVAQLTTKIRLWMRAHYDKYERSPSMCEVRDHFKLTLSDEDLHVVLWAVGNPNADYTVVLDPTEEELDRGGNEVYRAVAEESQAEMPSDLRRLHKELSKLTPFERASALTYGGSENAPLRRIGDEFGVSREWVNQTRKRVLTTLRNALRVKTEGN